MKYLRRDVDLDHFFAALGRNPNRGLLLDYDGTLAPFRKERDQAFPYPGVREIVDEIMAAGGTRVVIISGRAVDDIVPLLGFARRPEIRGSHGWERLDPEAEEPTIAPMAAGRREALDACRKWLAGEFDATRVEDKPASVALHWRGADAAASASAEKRARGGLEPIASGAGLELRGFDGGIEVRVPGRDKGTVAEEILTELGHGCAAAYLGDDDTDEDAFRAIAGLGLRLLVRETERPTLADLWIRPPGELLEFLSRWHAAVPSGLPPAVC